MSLHSQCILPYPIYHSRHQLITKQDQQSCEGVQVTSLDSKPPNLNMMLGLANDQETRQSRGALPALMSRSSCLADAR